MLVSPSGTESKFELVDMAEMKSNDQAKGDSLETNQSNGNKNRYSLSTP